MTSPYVRLGALAVMAAGLLSADAAFAQATKPTPSAPAAPAQPAGPIALNLMPLQSPWTKICGKDPSGKEICYTTRDFGQAENQPPTLAVAVYQLSGEDKRMARFLLPVGLLLRPGFRVVIDKSDPLDGRFAICFPNGCFGEVELNSAAINSMKKATNAAITVKNQGGLDVTFNVPMKDFGAAFDGPAVDPKVIEQQNAELQKKLQDQAEKQREALEKQQGVTTAPTPAPAPAK